MTSELDAAWAAAQAGFAWSDYAALLKAGVPQNVLPRIYREYGLGALDIAIENGKWRQMFRGERAIVVPVFVDSGELIDLVAFRPETPRSFWLLVDSGNFLGEAAIFEAEHFEKPLVVRETVLAWLKNACTGLVILNWKQLWPFWFAKVPALQFDDREYARMARSMMERPFRIPPVLVPAQ